MSLVRLLTAGKSLIGLKETPSRYQMRARHLLPRFGSGKNPFAVPSAPLPERAPAPAPSLPAAEAPAIYTRTPAELAAARLKETKKLPAPIPPVPGEASASPVVASFPPAWLRAWAKRLDLLAWWQRRPVLKSPFSRAGVPRPGLPVVQGELSLDRIKVVRNDLSDADVEVVSAKLSVRPKPEPKKRPELPAAETAELIKS